MIREILDSLYIACGILWVILVLIIWEITARQETRHRERHAA